MIGSQTIRWAIKEVQTRKQEKHLNVGKDRIRKFRVRNATRKQISEKSVCQSS